MIRMNQMLMPNEHETQHAARPACASPTGPGSWQGAPDSNSKRTLSAASTSWLTWVRLLLGIAILGAGYLAWVAVHHGPVAGCGPGSGCDKVLQSRWAYWLNVPVSIPALLVYLGLLAATVLLQKRSSLDEQRGIWVAIIGLSVIVAGAAAWFVGLQMFVIEAFCKFCLTAHACGFAAAVLCLRHIPLAADAEMPIWSSNPEKGGVPRKAIPVLVLTGLAGVLVLVGGQLLVQKERNLVKVFPPLSTNAMRVAAAPALAKTNSATRTGQSLVLPNSPNLHLVAPGLLSIYGGQLLVPLADEPMIGSPGASNVIVNLFDYNCPHCRLLHPILLEAQHRLGDQLGIVCLPMPMDTNCNPFVPAGHPTFTNSCDYARLGLAVWLANRSAYPEFENQMLLSKDPLPVDQARAYAAQLVGTNELQSALTNGWIQQQILMACYLHCTNWQATGGPAMPQLMIGPVISVGPLNSPNHLLVLLEKYLGIKPRPYAQGPGRSGTN
jgi:uncharacterized membrane protein